MAVFLQINGYTVYVFLLLGRVKSRMKKYIVGGYARDKLLGKKPEDKDWVVVGGCENDMLSMGLKKVGKSFPVFIDSNGEEFALARKERKTGIGHKSFEFDFNPLVSLEEDLQRRDFTINTFVMDEHENLVHTSLTDRALKDLSDRVLDIVDENHFTEDPLRALRAVRFAAILDFRLSASTIQAIRKIVASQELYSVSKERFYAEISKVFLARKASKFFLLMGELNLWSFYCKEISSYFSHSPEDPEKHPEGNTGGHIASALKIIDGLKDIPDEDIFPLYWAVLFHDIGKPFTPERDFPKHYNHDVIGEGILTKGFLNRLKVPQSYHFIIRFVCRQHMRWKDFNLMRLKKKMKFVEELTAGFKHDKFVKVFIYSVLADRYGKPDFNLQAFNEELDKCYRKINMIYSVCKNVKLTKEEIETYRPAILSDVLWRKRIRALSMMKACHDKPREN